MTSAHEHPDESAPPTMVRVSCPRCPWSSSWVDVDGQPNALWFAKRMGFNDYRRHFDAEHQSRDTPIVETA